MYAWVREESEDGWAVPCGLFCITAAEPRLSAWHVDQTDLAHLFRRKGEWDRGVLTFLDPNNRFILFSGCVSLGVGAGQPRGCGTGCPVALPSVQ